MSEIDPFATVPPGDDEPPASPSNLPSHIGRYRVDKVLGEGSFGRVYLASDEQLGRPVAIKVPHAHRVLEPEDIVSYLDEARVLASLDHPGIVPVYDFGTTDDGLCFVVSKLVEGSDLAARVAAGRPPFAESAHLVATVAEALHHAHERGLVHRDIKPANLLLDKTGKPYVADFGLALREEDFGKGAKFAGTPAYMSPEQARGEGHRVDGRSDVFSLGVVFYELLAGRRPFGGATISDLLEQITSVEARPPRQADRLIPKELERICLKALAKRASERYTTAGDMADDLHHEAGTLPAAPILPSTRPDLGKIGDDPRPIKVVPKGLRSFDADDADFFLDLLPGPRDRDGLPDGLRFWKTRIEETDPDKTFSVGLIYGPSGCGKSSLVKAGLLPRVSNRVTAVYVEATTDETEARLAKGLRKHCPGLPETLDLAETVAALRRGQYLPAGGKVLLVFDQFEQWLHVKGGDANAALVQALRHCDGGRVQCIILVRDDFGMAATRFMRAVDIPILQDRNFATVDLFDPLHARKVLAEFGRAFGRLPDDLGKCTKEQEAFLDRAVADLAEGDKVISVRLALFAEMVKGKTWTPTALKAVGGIEGVGVTFLEETFAASTAPPQYRLHQPAVLSVLKALLPESWSEIKGRMRSAEELRSASGYADRPDDFRELLRILDGELRLITPTDPEGADSAAEPPSQARRYYQLTHDYLVPSLREWLTRKQKESKQGRAELRLAVWSSVWNSKPENRNLPSWWEWVSIRLLTKRSEQTPPQRKMMRHATRYHFVQSAIVAVLLTAGAIAGLAIRGHVVERDKANHAGGLVGRLLVAKIGQVPGIISEIEEYRPWAEPLLREKNVQAAEGSAQKLYTSLALLPVDASQVDPLYDRLLDAEPDDVSVIHNALGPHKDRLTEKLWRVVEQPARGKESQVLRAASALAEFDPESRRWAMVRGRVADDLVGVNAVHLATWLNSFRPVAVKLLPPLGDVYRDGKRRETERSLATDILADYAADQPGWLADLLLDGDDQQFAVLLPKLEARGEEGLALLLAEVSRESPPDAKDEAKEKLAKRRANAAVALLRLKRPEEAWPLLKHNPDPRVRSYLIHRFAPLGGKAEAILGCLDREPDVTIRRGLLLSLGEYDRRGFSAESRKSLLPKLQGMYRTSTDPGLHAAAEWLLRMWNEEAWLKETNAGWKEAKQREERLRGIIQRLAKDREKAPPQWFVNGQGQTMVVVSGPVDFLMGSPSSEAGRQLTEPHHRKRIGRSFALSAKLVTVEEYRQFDTEFKAPPVYIGRGDLPVVGILWHEAGTYCNWLSKEESIPEDQWCYEVQKGQPTKPKANYLRLTGYRLPTEAEMEFATRAGAMTSRYYGETEELLPKYAWYQKNASERTWPVGRLKPNDLGLFDAQGNAFTWCQESYKDYPTDKEGAAHEDREDDFGIATTLDRVVRGGSFYNLGRNVRSAYRLRQTPTIRSGSIGFRVARTFPP